MTDILTSEIKKYRTWSYGNKIELITVERETESSVWINGRRSAKKNTFFDTWQNAKDYLLSCAEQNLITAKARLQSAQSYYGNIKGLRQLK